MIYGLKDENQVKEEVAAGREWGCCIFPRKEKNEKNMDNWDISTLALWKLQQYELLLTQQKTPFSRNGESSLGDQQRATTTGMAKKDSVISP